MLNFSALLILAIATTREDLICPPKLVVCDNYIGEKSILLLKRELGLD